MKTLRHAILFLALGTAAWAQEDAGPAAPAEAVAVDAGIAPVVAENNASDFAPAVTPFGFADFSWVPGNYGGPVRPMTWGPFSGEFRADVVYHHSFANPSDNTISGSSEVFRHGEVQVTQLGIGGDFYYKGAHGRLMTQFGMYSQTTPRNDASPARGQWNLADAYRYISEAYAGYHFDVLAGINVQAGIFMSYIGLWSYYNFDNWTYQPSYVSSNTPWFFNGVRAQIYVNDKLKIEPWLVNGWQSYGRFNNGIGGGGQIVWRPNGNLSFVSNNYFGTDTLGNAMRYRIHTDDSAMAKYYENKGGIFSKGAVSLTLDAGCEFGGGVTCDTQFFYGFMAYHRAWFFNDKAALTVGGGAINNPGRYLVLLPPINGTTAASGTPYFTANPGDPYMAWDFQITTDIFPVPYVNVRAEFNHRAASVPYFSGRGGVTPPGGNQGAPGSLVDGWTPDLVPTEDRLTVSLSVKI
ncbi:MAG: outer membrane beta-barrel protein [Archangium sp.]|nr:outer membrane beta-barrel protein [Archangium sp.]